MAARPRSVILPRPVAYAARMPLRPIMTPPVGKSGPLMCSIRPARSMSGSWISATMPSMTSRMLWGGILVAIPTAMPLEPLMSRFGTRQGSTLGSCLDSSKFGTKSTVSFSISRMRSTLILLMRASVYR